ncbi:MAG: cytochrome c [Anaerolineae bacterium]|nr:cytochrome c [Anaerolineae bacterium]
MAKRVLLIAVLGMAIVWGGALALAHGDGDAEHGAALYAENCLACHGPQGESRAAHEAFAAAVRYDTSFVDVVAQGVDGTYMPGWAADSGGPLSDEDIADLSTFVQTWGEHAPQAIPAPSVPDGLDPEASAGAALYMTNCVGCHGPQGEGRGLAQFPPIGKYADVLAVARRGVAGSDMPPFAQAYDGPLSEEELASILAYTRTWERTPEMVALAEEGPQGAAMLILLIGLGAVALVAGLTLTTRHEVSQ